MLTNFILNTDSYKASHYLQYPPNTTYVSSYIESRGGDYKETLFFGLQIFLKEYLTKPFTQEDIKEGEEVLHAHGLPFNKAGWQYILDKYKGYLPLQIDAVTEGTVIPTKNILLQIVNTDPSCYWLPSYIETALLRAVWYPTTVASISWYCKQIIKDFLERTADNTDTLTYKLHDFGARSATSLESAGIGGCAHLVNFLGTDTLSGILYAKKYYQEPMAGFSIPAAEHGTLTCWGEDHEKDAFENMLKQFAGEGKMVAVVSDSYNIFNAIDNVWGKQLKEKVIHNGGVVVIRPDSGEPCEIVSIALEKLMNIFGYTVNSKGFKVLPHYVRIIQGDGVSPKTIPDILRTMEIKSFSADNITFGMGGELLQKFHRDTFNFAMKVSAAQINGVWHDVYKDPITAKEKTSKKGRLALIKYKDGYKTIRLDELAGNTNLLQPVFKNGAIIQEYTFKQIRDGVK